MAYVIRITYPKLDKKQSTIVNALFDDDNFKKYILKRTSDSILLTQALFDYLEYDFNTNSIIKNKASFMLLEKNSDNKFKKIVENCKMDSDEFNEILRIIRF